MTPGRASLPDRGPRTLTSATSSSVTYTPYDGDASFLAGATDKTLRLWDTLEKDYLSEERKVRILDVDTHIPADIDAFRGTSART